MKKYLTIIDNETHNVLVSAVGEFVFIDEIVLDAKVTMIIQDKSPVFCREDGFIKYYAEMQKE